MKRTIAFLLSLAIVIALCPAIVSTANPGESKIDLSGYIEGMTSASNFDQPVATASASYENWGLGVAALLDGNTATRFIGVNEADVDGSAAFSPMWVQLDLQNVYTVSKVEFNSFQNGTNAGLPTAFAIQVSKDGTAWTTVHTETDMPLTTVPDSSLYSFSFDAVEARYVKLDVTAIGAACDVGNYVCLSEMAVYAVEGAGEEVTPVGLKITPAGVTASESLELWGFGAANLIDDSLDTLYCSESTGAGTAEFREAWITVDLQEHYMVDQFKYFSYAVGDAGRPSHIVIETSLDGETWTEAYRNENVPVTTVPDNVEYAFAFPAVEARYVKLTVKAVAANWDLGPCVCLREIAVYGVPAEEGERGEKLDIDAGRVTVSDEYTPDMGKNNLFDGNLDSIYAAVDPEDAPGKRMDEWIQLDLQQEYTVTRIRLANRSNANPLGGMPTVFDILVSDDGETWTTVKSVSGITESDIKDECWLTVDVDPVEARYVRIRVYDIGGVGEAVFGYSVTLREFEVHTADGKIDLTSYAPDLDSWSGHPGGSYIYYASNYPQTVATASQSYELWGWGIAGLIDGVVATDGIFACHPNSDSAGPSETLKNVITVDLNAAYFLDAMRFASIAANSLAGVPTAFKLEVSLDGANWKTVISQNALSVKDADSDGRFYTFRFNKTDAIRFVRLTVTSVGGEVNDVLGYCTALSELELYGILDPTTDIKPDGYGQIDLSKAVIRASNSYNQWGHGTGNLYNGSQNQNMFIGVSVDDADYYVMFKDTEVFENACNEFIKIRLDGIYKIDLMRFQSQWAGSGQGVPNKYLLEVSLDGKNWTPALSVDGQEVSETDWYSREIPAVQARYLRLNFYNVVEAGDLGYVPHLKELEFYGVLIEKDEVDLDVPAPIPPELDPIPTTGADAALLICALLTTASAVLLAVLFADRRRRIR